MRGGEEPWSVEACLNDVARARTMTSVVAIGAAIGLKTGTSHTALFC
jgi:hypothetical protein